MKGRILGDKFLLTSTWKQKNSKILKAHKAEQPMAAALQAYTTFSKSPSGVKGELALEKLKVLRNRLDAAAKTKDAGSFEGYVAELDSYVFDIQDRMALVVQTEYESKKKDLEDAQKDCNTQVAKLDGLMKEVDTFHKERAKAQKAELAETRRLNAEIGKLQKDLNLRTMQVEARKDALNDVQAAALKVKKLNPAIHQNVTKTINDAKKDVDDLKAKAKEAGMVEKDLE